jgi:hypothetical protein
MADAKISALTNLTAADAINDMIPIVDVSDTPPASGNTKRISINNILSSSPTASGNFTITGDLTVDTNTLKVDSTNDNVIVGATSAIGGGRFSVQADLSAKQAICAKNSAASYSATSNFIRFTNSTDATVGGITHPAVTSLGVWGVSDIQFLLSGAGTTAMTLNSTANLVLKGGTAGATGVGVTFPATQVASSDANCLDDYEEGTWTPNIGGTATYTTQTGTYTKIGNRVYVSLRLTVLLAGTGEDFRISGLPFASGSGLFAVSVGYFASLKTNAAFLSGYITGSQIAMTGTTVSTATMTNLIGVIGNGTDIAISGFYNV